MAPNERLILVLTHNINKKGVKMLSDKTIQELISIFQEEFGETISEEEAQICGLRIAKFAYAKDSIIERRKNHDY